MELQLQILQIYKINLEKEEEPKYLEYDSQWKRERELLANYYYGSIDKPWVLLPVNSFYTVIDLLGISWCVDIINMKCRWWDSSVNMEGNDSIHCGLWPK